MKNACIAGAGLGAVALIVFYYSIPFLIVRGVPDSVGRLRPFILGGSALFLLLGCFQSLMATRSGSPVSKISASVFWSSAIVLLGLTLFPQQIANSLANSLAR